MADIIETLESILNELRGLKAEKEALENGDYFKDGLIYCGKCNTQKEAIVTYFGKVPCMCKCETDEYNRKQELQQKEAHRLELQNKRGSCFDSVTMCDYTFEKCTIKDDPLYVVSYDYANNFDKMLEDGEGLTFFGTVGTGKTYLAAAIANEVIERGYTARMTNFATIASELQDKNNSPATYIKSLMNNDLLILDDLDAERTTGYMQEIVHNIIDRRHISHKPLIVTTNLTSKKLKSRDDESKSRIYSRLMDMTLPIEFSGEDMREESLKKKFEKYRNIIHLPDKKKGTK